MAGSDFIARGADHLPLREGTRGQALDAAATSLYADLVDARRRGSPRAGPGGLSPLSPWPDRLGRRQRLQQGVREGRGRALACERHRHERLVTG